MRGFAEGASPGAVGLNASVSQTFQPSGRCSASNSCSPDIDIALVPVPRGKHVTGLREPIDLLHCELLRRNAYLQPLPKLLWEVAQYR